MHIKKPRAKKEKTTDDDVPRDMAFNTGVQVLKDLNVQTGARNVNMQGVNISNVSAATTRKIGLACLDLKTTSSDFVALFLQMQPPSAKVHVNSLLGAAWLHSAAEQLHSQRRSAARAMGAQMVRTKDGAFCAANMDEDLQVKVADVEAALGYAWAQIRAVSGRCVIDDKALGVLLSPLGNIEAWVRCFLSGLHPPIVQAHGKEAVEAMQRNPMLKATLQSLQFDVGRLEQMVPTKQ